MTDLQLFLSAMDGLWAVDRYELEADDRLRIVYRSLAVPGLVWSHNPRQDFGSLPPVGAVGRIGFVGTGERIPS